MIYSWGNCTRFQLGHDFDKKMKSINIFEPKLINISNVISICSLKSITYFLTNDGNIYFCGQLEDDSFQKTPKLMKNNSKLISLHSIGFHQKSSFVRIGVTNDFIYHFNYNNIEESKHKNIFDFFSFEHKMTPKTIDLNEEQEFQKNVALVNDLETAVKKNSSERYYS